jgi:hypothetical protein
MLRLLFFCLLLLEVFVRLASGHWFPMQGGGAHEKVEPSVEDGSRLSWQSSTMDTLTDLTKP